MTAEPPHAPLWLRLCSTPLVWLGVALLAWALIFLLLWVLWPAISEMRS